MMISQIRPETTGFTVLTEEELQQLAAAMKQAVEHAEASSAPGIQSFAREKADSAAEAVRFLLAQRHRALANGLPDSDSRYYHLLNRKLARFMAVFVALFRVEPGYLYGLADTHPQVLLWVLSSADIDPLDPSAARLSLLLVDKLQAQVWLDTVSLATSTQLIETLQSAAISQIPQSELAMRALVRRHELNAEFATKCIRDGSTKVSTLARHQLACSGHEAGINWVIEHGDPAQSLFTHLLVRKDKVAWLRGEILPQKDAFQQVDEYAIVNRLPESFTLPDFQHDEKAYLKAALAGDPLAVEPMIEALFSAQDDVQQEQWLSAIFLILGEQMPVRVADLGVKYEAQQAAELLMHWWQHLEPEAVQVPMMRMGGTLSYATSIDVLKSASMPALFRTWVWRDLCLNGGIYVPYDPMSWPEKQRRAINTLSKNSTASERYNQRMRDAAVGR
ncbi:hypothetical protein [Photobacterium halotolerans]|uniref:Uncharacterized protein n=1 Tax=Photobacterium halotolerans TaxID=265726 RepID=A0A7X4W924_9GAMM|nr:hypothetical protein [Photobacterium halotolerans]NAW64379.1 hypothetical protein [Photobacterium halotolerans]